MLQTRFKFMKKPPMQRLLEKIKVGEANDCWEWQSPSVNQAGYGIISHKASDGRKRYIAAHRLMFTLTREREIGQGNVIMHICDNAKCCNPAHLQEGTQAQNNADMTLKGNRYFKSKREAA